LRIYDTVLTDIENDSINDWSVVNFASYKAQLAISPGNSPKLKHPTINKIKSTNRYSFFQTDDDFM